MNRRTSFRGNSGCTDEEVIETTMMEEMKIIINLAIPSIVAQMGWSVPSALVASYIGRHYGSVYLDAYMLVMVVLSVCTFAILEGIFSALDTLLPQAYGAKKYKDLQYICVRCFIVCMIIIVPVIIVLSFFLDDILIFLGQDEEASKLAIQWFRIYSYCLPFYAIFHTISTFLSAQNIMTPEVVAVLISALIVLPILLQTLGPIGFIGTGIAEGSYQIIQTLGLLIYVGYAKPYHPSTWSTSGSILKSGIIPRVSSWTKAMKWKPFSSFLWLSAGGILARYVLKEIMMNFVFISKIVSGVGLLCFYRITFLNLSFFDALFVFGNSTDYVYWEVVSLFIGSMGVTQLSAHTIPTQVIGMTFMVHLGISIAVSIRVGNVISQSVSQTQRICWYSLFCSSILFALMAAGTYVYREFIYSLFTTEQDVIDFCEEIWVKVTIYSFNMGMFTVVDGISTGLGKQWLVGYSTLVLLFILGIPALYYFSIYEEGGLNSAWFWLLIPNIALSVVVSIGILMSDWDAISEKIREEDDDDDSEYVGGDDDDGDDDQYDDDEDYAYDKNHESDSSSSSSSSSDDDDDKEHNGDTKEDRSLLQNGSHNYGSIGNNNHNDKNGRNGKENGHSNHP